MAHPGHVQSVQDAELHEHQQAPGIGGHLVEGQTPVGNAERLHHAAGISGEILLGKISPGRATARNDLLRHPSPVERVAASLRDGPQNFRKVRLAHEASERGDLSIRQKSGTIPATVIQDLPVPPEPFDKSGVDRKALFGVSDGGGQRLAQRLCPVIGKGLGPAVHHARHGRTPGSDHRDAIGIHCLVRRTRGRSRGVDPDDPTVPRDQHEPITAQAAGLGVNNREDRGGGYGRINGVSPVGEHAPACGSGQGVSRRNGAAAANDQGTHPAHVQVLKSSGD